MTPVCLFDPELSCIRNQSIDESNNHSISCSLVVPENGLTRICGSTNHHKSCSWVCSDQTRLPSSVAQKHIEDGYCEWFLHATSSM